MQHYNITIRGRVQGVGFRFTARNMARAYGIRGFIRNEPDGSVYIEAEGKKENLSLFISWCRKGPDAGRVDDVQVEAADPADFRSFTVRF